MIRDTLKRTNILTNTSGNIGLSAALVLPLVVLSLGLGVDFGYLTLQKQELQGVADLTAIVAASDLPNLETAARNHFKTNGLSMAIATKNGLINPDGKVIPKDQFAAKNGIATIVTGRYVPDPSLPTGQRFIANATPADAAQVTIEKEGTIHLAAMFSKPPTMSATGTAASTKLASFSVGSRLASLNDGILNQLLGQMLGTTISLKLMDYQALVNADINIQPFLKNVSTRLNLTAASYDDVLKANITMPQLLASMQAVQGVSAAANSALKALETATKLNKKTFTLSQILNIDPKKAISVNAGSNWAMKVSALDIVSTAAALANGNKQISLAAIAGLPGIASASVNLAIGEPPVTTPSHRLGAPGSAVRTAQTRLMIEVNIDGLALLAGLKIKLPIYVEVAYAEAKLADIRCYGGSATNASVSIDAVPGVAEIAIEHDQPNRIVKLQQRRKGGKSAHPRFPAGEDRRHCPCRSHEPEATETDLQPVRSCLANSLKTVFDQGYPDLGDANAAQQPGCRYSGAVPDARQPQARSGSARPDLGRRDPGDRHADLQSAAGGRCPGR